LTYARNITAPAANSSPSAGIATKRPDRKQPNATKALRVVAKPSTRRMTPWLLVLLTGVIIILLMTYPWQQ